MTDDLPGPSSRSLASPARSSGSDSGGAKPPAFLLNAGRNITKAQVWLLGTPPEAVVVKDISSAPAWFRWWGRWLLAREARTYRALAGVPGVPLLLSHEDRDRLVLTHVEGVPLPGLSGERVGEELFDGLARLLRAIHERGVACGDLHHRNVIVSPSGAVHVVDFAMAAIRKPGWRPLSNWLFRRLAELDEAAVVRMRVRYLRRPPSEAERKVLRRGALLWRVGRGLKSLLGSARSAGGQESHHETSMSVPSETAGDRPETRDPLLGRLRLGAVYVLVAALSIASRPTLGLVAAGGALVLLGESVRIWAAGHLLKSRELVTSGPYRYTQNPLYLGRLLILTGFCLMARLHALANLAVLAVGWAVFFLYYLPRKIRVEGSRLQKLHGGAWESYFRSVPVLFPRLTPHGENLRAWDPRRFRRNREHWMAVGVAAVTLFFLLKALRG